MSTPTFTATKSQRNILEGIAYRQADTQYILERYGADDPELQKNHKTILSLLADADKAAIPFWVQNAVLAFAEDWRRYKSQYLDQYLKTKQIYI